MLIANFGAIASSKAAALSNFVFDAESETIFTALTAASATPNDRRKYTIDRLVKRLKAAGVWAKFDPTKHALWVLAGNAAGSRINIINPGTHNLTSNGSPTFTAPGTGTVPGFAFPLITDFLDSGIAVNSLAQNDLSIGCYTREQSSSTVSFDMGAQTTGAAIYLKKASSTRACVAAINGANASPLIDTASWDGVGLYALSRISSANYTGHHGGINVGTVTDSSTANTASTTMTVGKVNGQTTTCKATISAAYISSGLTAAQVESLHAALGTYLDAVEYGDLDIHEAGYQPQAPAAYDAVIYGATLAGVCAAYRLAQLGRSVAIVGGWRERNLGGMTGNGLSFVDFDVPTALGGLAYDIIIAARAIDGNTTTHTSSSDLYATARAYRGAMRRLLDGARTNGQSVPIFWSDGVSTVQKSGTRITSFTTVDGRTFEADYFLDTSEELDLAHMAECSTIIGREAMQLGDWERLNGWRDNDRSSGSNGSQLENASNTRMPSSDAYNTIGNAGSGLIFGILPKPAKTLGQADSSVMSYNFRLPWNSQKSRRIPFGSSPPANYDVSKYELLGRFLTHYPTATINTLFKPSVIAGGTTDTNNNAAISTNLINSGNLYTECESAGSRAQVYEAREAVQKQIEDWIRGYIHFVLNSGDGRIPAGIVTALAGYGWDYRNFLDPHPNDSLYWPGRVYVREHRRLVGDFIADAIDATKTDGTTPRSIKTISTVAYRFDSHIHQRWVDTASSTIFCEGSIDISSGLAGGAAGGANGVTPVPYEAYLPKETECTNLGVTFGISSTHVFITAGRMEFTTAQAGESLAYAIDQAMDNSNQDLHDVTYSTLRTAILAAPTTYAPVLPQVN